MDIFGEMFNKSKGEQLMKVLRLKEPNRIKFQSWIQNCIKIDIFQENILKDLKGKTAHGCFNQQNLFLWH